MVTLRTGKISAGIRFALLLFIFQLIYMTLFAQADSSYQPITHETNTYTNKFAGDTADQRDLINVLVKIFKPRHFKRSKLEPGNLSFIILPGVYYSIPTGAAYTLNASIVYYS